MQYNEEYFNSEDFKELLESYETALQAGERPFMDADDLVDLADYYNYNGEGDKAAEAIERALDLYPDATLPNVFKAREALMMGDNELAHHYAEAIGDKDDPDYHYLTAEILIAEGHIKQADLYLRRYAKSVNEDEWEDFIKDCANLYVDYGVNDKAYQWMMRSKGDDSSDFKELMARTLMGLGKYKDSEKLFNELIDRDPYSSHYWNALATAQFMDEDYQNSIQSSEYAIAIDPNDPDSLISKANGLFKLNNYEEALEYFRRYAEQVPDDEFAYMNQGTCLINMGRNEEAIDMLNKAIEVADGRPDYLPDIYQELAFAYSETDRIEEAMQCLEMTDTMDCDHVQVEVVKGHILLAAGRLAEAEFYFKDAIQQSLHPYKTLMRVIVSLYDNRYVEAAYQMFLSYFENAEDDNADGYAYMALCCYEMKRYKEFLVYLKKACEVNPKESKLVLSHLFPDDLEPESYYTYIYDKMKGKDL